MEKKVFVEKRLNVSKTRKGPGYGVKITNQNISYWALMVLRGIISDNAESEGYSLKGNPNILIENETDDKYDIVLQWEGNRNI